MILPGHGVEAAVPWIRLTGNSLHATSIASSRSQAAGLRTRPLAETLRDTLAWWPTTPETRRAYFACTLCVIWPDGTERIFEGRVQGTLAWPPRGQLGHGYDPMFVPDGETRTFAELAPEEKNRISHRARALEKLVRDLF